jgi:hypothetical protein
MIEAALDQGLSAMRRGQKLQADFGRGVPHVWHLLLFGRAPQTLTRLKMAPRGQVAARNRQGPRKGHQPSRSQVPLAGDPETHSPVRRPSKKADETEALK